MLADGMDPAVKTCSSCGRGTYTVPSEVLAELKTQKYPNRRIGPGVFTKRQEAKTRRLSATAARRKGLVTNRQMVNNVFSGLDSRRTQPFGKTLNGGRGRGRRAEG